LTPKDYLRIPWKNGRGELISIDREGAESWDNMGVAWHFGRTAIIEEGPFSDYTGYERLQVVVKGTGLVLIAPDHEIDLRRPMRLQRYDGGTPIRTVLERGPVEVVNLIADRAQFSIELRSGEPGADFHCQAGRHIMYAPTDLAHIDINGWTYALADDHALRVRAASDTSIAVRAGQVLIGSILERP
jgi:uncharacterized protein